MEWFEVFADGLRNVFALLAAELLLVVPSVQRRDNFAVRAAVSAATCTAVCAVYVLFYVFLHDYIGIISIVWYFAVAVFAGAVIYACFNVKVAVLLWTMLAAYAVQHIVYVLVNEILFAGLLGGRVNFWVQLAVYLPVCAAFYCLFWLIYRKNVKHLADFYLGDGIKVRLLFGLFFVIFIAATFMNQYSAVSGEKFNYISALVDLINCLFISAVQFAVLAASRINWEKNVSQKLLEAEKRQYASFKNTVDYINIKCHDLKHELAAIKAGGGNVNVGRLEEAAKNIAIYDAFAKTGNENLDIILTEKNLACIKEDISFTYMAEAAALSKMEAEDIYSLFGNLLDNAIDYEKTVPETEKRFIRLFVKPQGNMLVIHSENYFEGQINFSDGLPATTKRDKTLHGFGMRSMRATARKYGGEMRAGISENLFKTDIILRL